MLRKLVNILLNEIIKNRRIQLGLSRKNICENLCSESTLYRFESGLHDINSHLLVEICNRLKLETVIVTDIKITKKEHALFLLMQHFIYKKNIKELENILNSFKNESLSRDWFKIKNWCQAVIHFYKKEYILCENIISNHLKISEPKNSLDLLILNTLILNYISQNNYIKALEVATNCIHYIDTHKVESIDINSKVKYSYAHALFKNNYKKESEEVIIELIEMLLNEKTFFLLGKCYFFLYVIYKNKKLSLAHTYLKLSYMTFQIENSDIPQQVKEEMKHLKDSSIYL